MLPRDQSCEIPGFVAEAFGPLRARGGAVCEKGAGTGQGTGAADRARSWRGGMAQAVAAGHGPAWDAGIAPPGAQRFFTQAAVQASSSRAPVHSAAQSYHL